jgi:hypothetical protein
MRSATIAGFLKPTLDPSGSCYNHPPEDYVEDAWSQRQRYLRHVIM